MRSLLLGVLVLVGSVAQAQCPPTFLKANKLKANKLRAKLVPGDLRRGIRVNSFHSLAGFTGVNRFDDFLFQQLAAQQLISGGTLYGPSQVGLYGGYHPAPLDPNLSLRIAERAIKRSQDLVERSLRQLFELQQAAAGKQGPDEYLGGTETLPAPRVQVTGGVQEVFANNCVSCHSGATPRGALDLTNLNALSAEQRFETFARVVDPDPQRHMPQGGEWLSVDEIVEVAKFGIGGIGTEDTGSSALQQVLKGIDLESVLNALKPKGGNP